MCIESSILLAKLYLSQSKFNDALEIINSSRLTVVFRDHYTKLEQHQQTNGEFQFSPKYDSLRQLQLFAEIHSIHGLCLEKKHLKNALTTKPSQKLSEETLKQEEQQIIDSFEIASLLAISHSVLMHQLSSQNANSSNLPSTNSSGQNAESSSGTSTLNNLNSIEDNLDLINPLYEIALQKAPLLYIKRGCAILPIYFNSFRFSKQKKNVFL